MFLIWSNRKWTCGYSAKTMSQGLQAVKWSPWIKKKNHSHLILISNSYVDKGVEFKRRWGVTELTLRGLRRHQILLVFLSQSQFKGSLFSVVKSTSWLCESTQINGKPRLRQSIHPPGKVANLSEMSIAWILQFGSGSMPRGWQKVGRSGCLAH